MDTFSLFPAQITQTIYYSSIPEALATFTITIIAAIISLLLLLHTTYKFYVEDISHILEDTDNYSQNNARNSKTRAKLPKVSPNATYGSDEPSHHKEIHHVIALLTILYLFSGACYTLTQSTIRVLTIFFASQTSCQLNEYLQIFVAATRSLLYILFLARLYLTFLGSHLAYSAKIIIILGTMILLANFSAITYWIINTTQQIQSNHGNCSPKVMDYTYPSLVVIIIDTMINIVLLYAFVHKLSQLIQTQTAGYDVLDATTDPSALTRIKDLIKLMTKLTLLACMAVIMSWMTTVAFMGWIPGIVTQIDVVFGAICILFCYEFHKARYMNYCFLPRQFMYHVCFWWFISEDYICRKNDEVDYKKNGFEGGCCAVLCVFKKYDGDQGNVCLDATQELHTKESTTLKQLSGMDVYANKDGNGMDAKSELNAYDNVVDKGKYFTDEIFKTPTDDFGKTLSVQQSVRKGDKNYGFAHRAYTLKKIHHLLAEDEEIEDNMQALRFTLRRSKKAHTLRLKTLRSLEIEIEIEPMQSIKESMDIDQQKLSYEQIKLSEKNGNEDIVDEIDKQLSAEIVYQD